MKGTLMPTDLDPSICTCSKMRKASRAITRIYEAALQSSSLSVSQFNLLCVLDSRGGLALTALAEVLDLDRTTLTRNLKPMERDGLIAIHGEQDQRKKLIELTDTGRLRHAAALPLWNAVQSKLMSSLGPDTWNILDSALSEVRDTTRAL
jgi:DNA-binding MarR family transcriptional regulator